MNEKPKAETKLDGEFASMRGDHCYKPEDSPTPERRLAASCEAAGSYLASLSLSPIPDPKVNYSKVWENLGPHFARQDRREHKATAQKIQIAEVRRHFASLPPASVWTVFEALLSNPFDRLHLRGIPTAVSRGPKETPSLPKNRGCLMRQWWLKNWIPGRRTDCRLPASILLIMTWAVASRDGVSLADAWRHSECWWRVLKTLARLGYQNQAKKGVALVYRFFANKFGFRTLLITEWTLALKLASQNLQLKIKREEARSQRRSRSPRAVPTQSE